jgi:hypothetical protein
MRQEQREIEEMKKRRIDMHMEHRKNKTFLKDLGAQGGPRIPQRQNTLSGVLE